MKLLTIPFAGGEKTLGTRGAPDRIIGHLHHLFLNEQGRDSAFQIINVPINQNSLEETNKNIVNNVAALQERAIVLGGDHSITPACMKAFVKSHPGAGIVIFDAHPDADNVLAPAAQDDLLILLLNEELVAPERIILVGKRCWTLQERQFLEKHRIRVYSMADIHDAGVEAVCDAVMEAVREWPAFYLSIDIDVVDPAFAPGTSFPEPGGLSSREMIYFCQRLKLLKNFGMADIVEVNPELDINNLTSRLAAKMVRELS